MDKLKLGAIGEKLKTSGVQMGRMVSGKMKDLLQAQTTESKLVDEATSDNLEEPNWGMNLRICGMLNSEEFSGPEVMKAIKKKISGKSVVSQKLSLDLLEACAMNCEKVFSEIASEKVLEEMVKMIDNPLTLHENRMRALQLIRAWGESEDLVYLPVFRQIYDSLKARGPTLAAQDGNPAFPSLGSNINQQPLVPPANYPISDMDLHDIDDDTVIFPSASLSTQEKKEFLVTTRNSVELLSTILNAEEPMAIEDDLTSSILEKCKDAQPIIQRIIEGITNDEAMLFEALNLNDEIQQVISKYEEIQTAARTKGKSPDSCETVGNSSPVQVDAVAKV
ncbi:Tom1-like protein [Thalictrum thalictroides]|uniref:Tom1-like protein n=1 Tax=Thalictrum thalictroides TaxID=46969 RepID=A0A7J6WDW0_THATH|nr:Tom1-like protein [Thalictrum thalictroides]